MMQTGNKLLQAAASFCLAASVFVALIHVVPVADDVRRGFTLGVCLSTFNVLASYSALYWTFKRSNTAFFTAFFGGLIWKLVVLAATVLFVMRHPAYHPMATLVTLAFSTFALNLVETRFLKKMGDPSRNVVPAGKPNGL
jgi:uncharacterized membrane protein YfbV (UPF0208 family)